MGVFLKNRLYSLFFCCLVAAILILSSCEEKKSEYPFMLNTSYHEARKIIIQNGWAPINALRSNLDTQYQSPRFYFEAEYTEVLDCSGTGMGYCAFAFKNNKNQYLKVTTQGGDYDPDDLTSPVVVFLSISDELN